MCHAFAYHVAANVWPVFGFDGFLLCAPRAAQRQMLIRGLWEACQSIGYPFKVYSNGQADMGRHRIHGCVIARKESHAAFHGGKFGGVMIDEVTLCDEETTKLASGRVSRPPRGNRIGKLFTSTNPSSPHHWWKEERINREPRAHVRFTVDDNPDLTQEYKDYLRDMWQGTMLQRMYHGEWVGFSGLVFPLFEQQCVNAEYPSTEPLGYDLTVDHATSSVTHANVFAVWPYHRRCVAEWMHNGERHGPMTTKQQCLAMMAHFHEYNKPFRRIYCDHAAQHMVVDMTQTIGPVESTYKAVLPGLQQCMIYLGQGFVSVDKEACPETVKQMTGYAWDSKAADRGLLDVPLKVNDHAPDAWRYYLYSEAQYEPVRIRQIVG